MRRSFFAALGALCLACGGVEMVPYSPLEQTTELAPDKLLEAAEGTLLERGYLIEDKDTAAFKIVTKKRTLLGSAISEEKYKYSWTVDTGGGRVRIVLDCSTGDDAAPTPCGAEGPAKIVKEQQEIVDQVLREASGG